MARRKTSMTCQTVMRSAAEKSRAQKISQFLSACFLASMALANKMGREYKVHRELILANPLLALVLPDA